MKAVIVVGHGSGRKISNQQFIAFAKEVATKSEVSLFRHAFLELASPSILEEIKVCVNKGATEIIVYPLLLLSANHAKQDIPNEIKRAKVQFPTVNFYIENPLGIQEVILTILEATLAKKQFNTENSLIVFVGRGSKSIDAIRDFEKISLLLQQKLHTRAVLTCFLTGGNLSFSDAIEKAKKSRCEHIFVLPYLLFHGILLKKIEDEVTKLNDERFIVCDPIGTNNDLIDLVSYFIKSANLVSCNFIQQKSPTSTSGGMNAILFSKFSEGSNPY